VLATGRIVRDNATRRLTLVQGDASKPCAGWLGAHDHSALPAGERADQLAQDRAEARSPKVFKTLCLTDVSARAFPSLMTIATHIRSSGVTRPPERDGGCVAHQLMSRCRERANGHQTPLGVGSGAQLLLLG
jgi:hypothetical protein